MNSMLRRRFLENSMLATAAAIAARTASPVEAVQASSSNASNRVRVAIIGCRIRGKQHAAELAKVADCEIAYVCDPDSDLANELAEIVEKQQPAKPVVVQDMRRVFDDQSVDAVFVATPNHWHALAAIWAMQSGKDVYVEKPVSHNISEGRRIVQVARKLNRMCQGGTQNRSNVNLAEAIAYIQAGKLGEVKVARSIVYGVRSSIGPLGKYDVPKQVDFDLWSGPAPLQPLTRPTLHYDWHWDWQTGNGELGNNNIHSIDICRWGLGLTGLGNQVISLGGRFGYDDAGQTPNSQVCVFDFGEKCIVAETRNLKSEPYRPGFTSGWLFEGTEGSIAESSLFDRDGKLVKTFTSDKPGENHFANFIQAVRSRDQSSLNADILEGHQSTALCHAGNISWRLGHSAPIPEIRESLGKFGAAGNPVDALDRLLVHLDANKIDTKSNSIVLGSLLIPDSATETFTNEPRANEFLSREYRKPFVVPKAEDI